MSIPELFFIAVGLSMDAFAVAICKGLSMQKATLKKSVIVGLYFGGFQAIMPLIGYYFGSQFAPYITAFDHWIAFILLAIIGGKMIIDSLKKDDACFDPTEEADLSASVMLPMAVATSIDALAVGVSFAFLQVNIVWAVSFIGVVTFILAAAGLKIGNLCGAKFKNVAEIAGGVILVLIGLKILLEHTGIL